MFPGRQRIEGRKEIQLTKISKHCPRQYCGKDQQVHPYRLWAKAIWRTKSAWLGYGHIVHVHFAWPAINEGSLQRFISSKISILSLDTPSGPRWRPSSWRGFTFVFVTQNTLFQELVGGGWIRLIVGFQPLMVISSIASWIRWCMGGEI